MTSFLKEFYRFDILIVKIFSHPNISEISDYALPSNEVLIACKEYYYNKQNINICPIII